MKIRYNIMLEQIDEKDINKLSLRKSGKRFLLYQKAIESHIKKIEDNIAKSEDGFYRIGEKTLRDMLGEHLKNNGTNSIRIALKHIFWRYNIVTETKSRIDGKKDFYFRMRVKSDTTVAEPE